MELNLQVFCVNFLDIQGIPVYERVRNRKGIAGNILAVPFLYLFFSLRIYFGFTFFAEDHADTSFAFLPFIFTVL